MLFATANDDNSSKGSKGSKGWCCDFFLRLKLWFLMQDDEEELTSDMKIDDMFRSMYVIFFWSFFTSDLRRELSNLFFGLISIDQTLSRDDVALVPSAWIDLIPSLLVSARCGHFTVNYSLVVTG